MALHAPAAAHDDAMPPSPAQQTSGGVQLATVPQLGPAFGGGGLQLGPASTVAPLEPLLELLPEELLDELLLLLEELAELLLLPELEELLLLAEELLEEPPLLLLELDELVLLAELVLLLLELDEVDELDDVDEVAPSTMTHVLFEQASPTRHVPFGKQG